MGSPMMRRSGRSAQSLLQEVPSEQQNLRRAFRELAQEQELSQQVIEASQEQIDALEKENEKLRAQNEFLRRPTLQNPSQDMQARLTRVAADLETANYEIARLRQENEQLARAKHEISVALQELNRNAFNPIEWKLEQETMHRTLHAAEEVRKERDLLLERVGTTEARLAHTTRARDALSKQLENALKAFSDDRDSFLAREGLLRDSVDQWKAQAQEAAAAVEYTRSELGLAEMQERLVASMADERRAWDAERNQLMHHQFNLVEQLSESELRVKLLQQHVALCKAYHPPFDGDPMGPLPAYDPMTAVLPQYREPLVEEPPPEPAPVLAAAPASPEMKSGQEENNKERSGLWSRLKRRMSTRSSPTPGQSPASSKPSSKPSAKASAKTPAKRPGGGVPRPPAALLAMTAEKLNTPGTVPRSAVPPPDFTAAENASVLDDGASTVGRHHPPSPTSSPIHPTRRGPRQRRRSVASVRLASPLVPAAHRHSSSRPPSRGDSTHGSLATIEPTGHGSGGAHGHSPTASTKPAARGAESGSSSTSSTSSTSSGTRSVAHSSSAASHHPPAHGSHGASSKPHDHGKPLPTISEAAETHPHILSHVPILHVPAPTGSSSAHLDDGAGVGGALDTSGDARHHAAVRGSGEGVPDRSRSIGAFGAMMGNTSGERSNDGDEDDANTSTHQTPRPPTAVSGLVFTEMERTVFSAMEAAVSTARASLSVRVDKPITDATPAEIEKNARIYQMARSQQAIDDAVNFAEIGLVLSPLAKPTSTMVDVATPPPLRPILMRRGSFSRGKDSPTVELMRSPEGRPRSGSLLRTDRTPLTTPIPAADTSVSPAPSTAPQAGPSGLPPPPLNLQPSVVAPPALVINDGPAMGSSYGSDSEMANALERREAFTLSED